MNEKIRTIIKNYLPDILIIVGVWVFSYNILRPPTRRGAFSSIVETDLKVFGIILIVIGVDIVIRRYLMNKKK